MLILASSNNLSQASKLLLGSIASYGPSGGCFGRLLLVEVLPQPKLPLVNG
jgi:hypothetical protein